ncbi:hypothetical protein Q8W71_28955 [Methylobacterium sp. NEAU 140]|uniref:hypothetical protein n=1 Tax=Methylobacterium sp. NEAU 140 TaxID=3064945 RepID=UPI0027324DBD|nr:hypothetical protein [Methylobacterium sp. NEAU 140]MDP4026641.1 hypothetical protein [Methylobacterium sp. NEAU 140]
MASREIRSRLRRIEARRGFSFTGNVRQMSDAQLEALIRHSYADPRAEHGSLVQAVWNLRATGDESDAALATLIKEDIGGADARYH